MSDEHCAESGEREVTVSEAMEAARVVFPGKYTEQFLCEALLTLGDAYEEVKLQNLESLKTVGDGYREALQNLRDEAAKVRRLINAYPRDTSALSDQVRVALTAAQDDAVRWRARAVSAEGERDKAKELMSEVRVALGLAPNGPLPVVDVAQHLKAKADGLRQERDSARRTLLDKSCELTTERVRVTNLEEEIREAERERDEARQEAARKHGEVQEAAKYTNHNVVLKKLVEDVARRLDVAPNAEGFFDSVKIQARLAQLLHAENAMVFIEGNVNSWRDKKGNRTGTYTYTIPSPSGWTFTSYPSGGMKW